MEFRRTFLILALVLFCETDFSISVKNSAYELVQGKRVLGDRLLYAEFIYVPATDGQVTATRQFMMWPYEDGYITMICVLNQKSPGLLTDIVGGVNKRIFGFKIISQVKHELYYNFTVFGFRKPLKYRQK
uniref:Uncharacterized protein n=1 Tax=Clastoptera arizonana TaxID=38151 RepID=A0A1B6E5H2_9HEMI